MAITFGGRTIIIKRGVVGVLLLTIIFGGVVAWGFNKLSTQYEKKKFSRVQYANEPFVVTNISINGRRLPLSKDETLGPPTEQTRPLLTLDDWLQGLTFEIQNKSDKKIVAITFSLAFPETEKTMPLLVYEFRIGRAPSSKISRPPIEIAKDDKFTYALSDKDLNLIKQYVGRHGFTLADIADVKLRLTTIYFDDLTVWDMGEFYETK